MPPELQRQYVFGRRAGKERRTSPRYPFTATCDAMEPKSHAKIIARTSDLGRGGCYIDTIGPFPPGTTLVVRINRERQSLTIEGKVIFSQAGMGMGLSFTKIEPDQQSILDQWIGELSGEPVTPAAPAPSAASTAAAESSGNGRSSDAQPLYVVNELILLLLQKGVLSETEGKSLLQKLLR
jgi:hypothetical protein